MKREQIQQIVVNAIIKVQKMSGEPDTLVNLDTCPIDDLPEFDSQRGIETTVQIETDVGFQITDRNLFTSEKPKKFLTVREIVTRIEFLLAEGGKKK